MSKMNLHVKAENYSIYADNDNGYIKVARKNRYSSWSEEYWFRRTRKGNIKLFFPEKGPKTWDNVPMDGILLGCDYNRHNIKVLAQIFAQDIFKEEEANLPIIGKVEKYWKTKVGKGGWPIIPSLCERVIPVNNKKK